MNIDGGFVAGKTEMDRQVRKQSLSVVTGCDERQAALGELTSETASAYAGKFGYEFRRYKWKEGANRHVYWNKIEVLLEEVGKCDFTLWLDADALIVGSSPADALFGDSCLKVSKDMDGICCGVMLMRNCEQTLSLLRSWLSLGDVDDAEVERYEKRNLRDQTTLKCLMKNFPSIREQVGAFPESVVLHPKAEFVEDPFIMHYWASSGHTEGIARAIGAFRERGWSRECFYDWESRISG